MNIQIPIENPTLNIIDVVDLGKNRIGVVKEQVNI